MSGPQVHPVDTPAGPARVHLWRPPRAHGVLALGHGAGPSLTTVDLVATREVAVELGWAVALVEQGRVAVEVGEALSEVDGSVLVGERGHLGEDRRSEAAQPAGERVRIHGT